MYGAAYRTQVWIEGQSTAASEAMASTTGILVVPVPDSLTIVVLLLSALQQSCFSKVIKLKCFGKEVSIYNTSCVLVLVI